MRPFCLVPLLACACATVPSPAARLLDLRARSVAVTKGDAPPECQRLGAVEDESWVNSSYDRIVWALQREAVKRGGNLVTIDLATSGTVLFQVAATRVLGRAYFCPMPRPAQLIANPEALKPISPSQVVVESTLPPESCAEVGPVESSDESKRPSQVAAMRALIAEAAHRGANYALVQNSTEVAHRRTLHATLFTCPL